MKEQIVHEPSWKPQAVYPDVKIICQYLATYTNENLPKCVQ